MSTRIHLNLVIFCVLFTGCIAMSLMKRIITFTKFIWNIFLKIIRIPILPKSKEEFFDMILTILYEFPTRFAIAATKKFCAIAISTDKNLSRPEEEKPNSETLRIIFYNKGNASYHMSDMEILVNHPNFDKNASTVILISGWLTNEQENEATKTIYEAYNCRGHNNFLLVDHYASFNTLYAWSALNTEDLAELISPAIVELTKFIDVRNIHIIGHSLGAHIAGNIGRNYLKLTNKTLPRITGLDPANPCFSHDGELLGLEKNVAELVDVIHTNSDGLGLKDPIGDVDFYPNGRKTTMPGCIRLSCSHQMAWRYYAESVYPGNENAFLARKCRSFKAYRNNLCDGELIPMGYATPSTAEGSYYLETHKKAPFGMNSIHQNKCLFQE